MKKIYIKPSVEVVKIDTIQMIANSIDKGDSNDTITDPNDFEFMGRDDKSSSSNNIWDNAW